MLGRSLLLVITVLLAFSATAQNRLVSETVYQGLVEAEKLIDEKDEAAALSVLEKLSARNSTDDYERALISEMLGAIYANQGDFFKAEAAFEAVLRSQALPEEDTARVRYNLAQIYIMRENYHAAIQLLKAIWSSQKESSQDIAYLLASAYAALSDYKSALHWLEKVTAGAEPNQLPDRYLALAASLHLMLEDYQPAVRYLKILVARQPDSSSHWRQLVSAYRGLDDESGAFSALELGYLRGVLRQEGDIKELATFYLRKNLPYKAAVLLRDEMNAGRVKQSSDIDKLMASAWSQAREYDAAVPLLEKIAVASDSGLQSLSLAHLYVEQEKWQTALKWVETALNKGQLNSVERAYLLKGIVETQLENYASAEELFLRCLKSDDTRKQAIEWLEFIGSEAYLGGAGG